MYTIHIICRILQVNEDEWRWMDGRSFVDGRWWTKGAEGTKSDGQTLTDVERKLTDIGWNYDKRR
jgi:hypothetical protein